MKKGEFLQQYARTGRVLLIVFGEGVVITQNFYIGKPSDNGRGAKVQ
jgi:hypothetical protein